MRAADAVVNDWVAPATTDRAAPKSSSTGRPSSSTVIGPKSRLQVSLPGSWNRLIRSLAVLERKDEAQKIYDEARARFEGHAAELSFLKQAAVESGLAP